MYWGQIACERKGYHPSRLIVLQSGWGGILEDKECIDERVCRVGAVKETNGNIIGGSGTFQTVEDRVGNRPVRCVGWGVDLRDNICPINERRSAPHHGRSADLELRYERFARIREIDIIDSVVDRSKCKVSRLIVGDGRGGCVFFDKEGVCEACGGARKIPNSEGNVIEPWGEAVKI